MSSKARATYHIRLEVGDSMFADERKMRILAELKEKQSVSVSELAHDLESSESTIRRDLQELEEQGLLKRTHGGAVSNEVASFEPSVQEKDVQNQQEKYMIAKLAANMVRDGETVLLDAGTTTLQIAKAIADRNISVLTNSLQIGQELTSQSNIDLMVLGGGFRRTTGALVGPITESILSGINVDILFLGANGIDLVHGITTPNITEAATKMAMIRSARRVVLAADRTKLNQISMFKVCELSNLDVFMTDGELPPEYQAFFDNHNVEVIIGRELL
jgi:DeoR family transcriptional regulator, fructose operon transcriptional repressor